MLCLCTSKWFRSHLSWKREGCNVSSISQVCLLIDRVAWTKNVVKFPCLLYFRRYFVKTSSFFFLLFLLLFFQYSDRLFLRKLPKFIILLARKNFFTSLIHAFKKFSQQILEMCFPLLKYFFLPGCYYFWSWGAFSSTHFIYSWPS